GNRFNLDVCAIVNEKSPLETADDLWSALQSGLILPLSNDYKIPLAFQSEEQGTRLFDESRVGYRFLHDRVQQAAYSMIPENQKKATHLKIGKLLLHQYAESSLEENIFDIVNQLNIGVEFITQSEKNQLANFNLVAGCKAKAATAYEAAVKYLNVGLEILPESSWQSHYDLTRNLHLETLEAEYLNTNFERAQELSEIVLLQTKTLLEKIKVYELKIPFYLSQNQPQKALDTALQVLKQLGIFLPHNPNKLSIMIGLFRTKFIVGRKQIRDLANLPQMTNPEHLAAIRILMNIIPAAFAASPALFPLVVFKIVYLSVKYGNTALSAQGYCMYGMLLCGVLEDTDSGYQFGQLALTLLEQFNAREIKAKVYHSFNHFIRECKEPIKNTITPLSEAYKIGVETGDLEYAGYGALYHSINLFWSGEHLEYVANVQQRYLKALSNYKQEFTADMLAIWNQFVLNIKNQSANTTTLTGESFDESQRLSLLKEANNNTAVAYLYLAKSILFYLFKNFEKSLETAILLEKYKQNLSGAMLPSTYNFY
ncbi:MAG: serine/threonine protein kinase, partial [Coleofasciculaceae cyanobacterium]